MSSIFLKVCSNNSNSIFCQFVKLAFWAVVRKQNLASRKNGTGFLVLRRVNQLLGKTKCRKCEVGLFSRQLMDGLIGLLETICRFAMRDLSAQMFMRKTKLSATTKLSAEQETLPIANVLFWTGRVLNVRINF